MAGWAALLGGLGAVAIAFGLLTALLSAFQPVSDYGWVLGNLVVGVLLLGTALATSFESVRERLTSGEGRRAGKYGSSALLSTLLGIAILAMLAFLSTRYTYRFDWSEQKVHTLTDQSLQLLEGLEQDVEITAFFGELDAPPIRELLDRYTYASERVKLTFADPNARPDLIAAMGIDEAKLSRGLVTMSFGDDLVEITEFSEDKVTNALVSLTRSSDKKIYFLIGHNERHTDGEDSLGKEGLSMSAEALKNENYQVETLLLASAGDVPEDANSLIIAGPTRPLPDEEIAAIERYLDRGGSVFAMIDPRANTNLGEVLARWGVEVGDDIIVDMQLAFFQQYMSPFAGSFAEQHPITEKMDPRQTPTLFYVARSLAANPQHAESSFETVVLTGEKSWAERDLDEIRSTGRFSFGKEDQMGPVPVALAGSLTREFEGEARQARLVVIGDSDFATNELLARYGGNRDLFVNSVNWLLGDVEAISVRPHQARASRFVGSEEDVRAIQYLALFVLPETIAVIGVFAWWLRRKRPGR